MNRDIITIDCTQFFTESERDYDFLSLLKSAASAAEMEGAISEKQASWLVDKAKQLIKSCKNFS